MVEPLATKNQWVKFPRGIDYLLESGYNEVNPVFCPYFVNAL